MPLFERDDGAVVVKVQPEGNNRLKGFRGEFDEAQKKYDQGSSANGKARERIKTLAEESGISKKAISTLRQILRMDPREACAWLNDTALLMAEYGVFDAAEEAAQAEKNEANSASVEAAEVANAKPKRGAKKAPARIDGEPPGGIMQACLAQGMQAHKDGAPIEDCPDGFETDKRAWWIEGWLRSADTERSSRKSTAGKLADKLN